MMKQDFDFPSELDPIDTLDWKAFRYIAAEMPSAEHEAFELELASNHAAREAVAEMVRLSQLSASAFASGSTVTPASLARNRWTSPLVWMAAGAAACLAILATGYGIISTREVAQTVSSGVSPVVALADHDHVTLIRRVIELPAASAESWTADEGSSDDELLLAMASHVQSSDADPTVPGWLLAAVSTGSSADRTETEEN